MTLELTRRSDYKNIKIHMPSTNFNELVVKVTDTRFKSKLLIGDEIVVIITTEEDISTRHYQCSTYGDNKSSVHMLKLMDPLLLSQQSKASALIFIKIISSTIKKFKLETDRYDCFLQL